MKKTKSVEKTTRYNTTSVFASMGVAMDKLLQATPAMVEDGKFEGHEIHGKRKNKQKAA